MPEYLAPGVFVEEVSFRAKSIEGVPTSTTGFVGIAPFGPVQYPGGPVTSEPRLVTSFPEFERTYGKLDLLLVGGDQRLPYLAYAARAFFLNGGQRLYVSRVYKATDGDATLGVASVSVPIPTPTASTATWRARWPGSMGDVAVTTSITRCARCRPTTTDRCPSPTWPGTGSIVEVVARPGAVAGHRPPTRSGQPAHRRASTPTARRPSPRPTAPRWLRRSATCCPSSS